MPRQRGDQQKRISLQNGFSMATRSSTLTRAPSTTVSSMPKAGFS